MNVTEFIKNMKGLWLAVLFFAIFGCNATGGVSSQDPSGCPNQPGTLESKDVREITVSEDKVTQESGMLRVGSDIGYVFEGEAGQKLNYQTKDDICLWIFNVDNEVLSDTTLPKSGTYTIQAAVIKGSTTFNLDLSFGQLQAAPPESQNPAPPIAQAPSQQVSIPAFTKTQAIDLVGRWLDAKAQVFGRSYNSQPVYELLTGERRSDALKSIDTLRQGNAYYEYISNNIEAIGDLSITEDLAVINAVITEDMRFYEDGNLSSRYTTNGPKSTRYRIEFQVDNGIWKIVGIEKL